VTEALVGALAATQTRLAAGIAEAEVELARARRRCRELRETLALARAREAAAVVTPVREPDAREPSLDDDLLLMKAITSWAEAAQVSGAVAG
jgi:hypothetical protein